MKALEGRWESTLKAWRYDFDRKRSLLQALKDGGWKVEDHAKAEVMIGRCTSGTLITGDTFYVKTELRDAGGTWDPKLKGWIFREDVSAVRKVLKSLDVVVTGPSSENGAAKMVVPFNQLAVKDVRGSTAKRQRIVGKQPAENRLCKTSVSSSKKVSVSKADGSQKVIETHTKRNEVICAKTKKALETSVVTRRQHCTETAHEVVETRTLVVKRVRRK